MNYPLYDSNGACEDQLASVRQSPINRSFGAFDLPRLTNERRAEREPGITIDVAYRYFSTPGRKFILADTPEHSTRPFDARRVWMYELGLERTRSSLANYNFLHIESLEAPEQIHERLIDEGIVARFSNGD
jgi:sulfate adenylyltransferase subunit 1 (EFTu-like GTPase family)